MKSHPKRLSLVCRLPVLFATTSVWLGPSRRRGLGGTFEGGAGARGWTSAAREADGSARGRGRARDPGAARRRLPPVRAVAGGVDVLGGAPAPHPPALDPRAPTPLDGRGDCGGAPCGAGRPGPPLG